MLIEVVYLASATIQSVVELELPSDSTVLGAVVSSGLLEKHPEINLLNNKVGIFGNIVALDHKLLHSARVEIYRNLAKDPNQSRLDRSRN